MEIQVASISPSTIRITVLPIDGTVADDGALVAGAAGRVLDKRRRKDSFAPVKAGNLSVRFTNDPPVLEVTTASGQPVQVLRLDAAAAGLSFALGKGPLLGFGEGGAQFDRRGVVDRMRNGQGGYQLRTHGGRVPIQWLIGTEGWGLYIHQPLGTFDLSGAEGKIVPFADALPLDVFITASADPKQILGEYARITGFAELPALWTFGYMQSHRTLSGPDEVMWVARTFREKQLPCDALIYLGTEFTPSGWNTRNGEFTGRRRTSPNPGRCRRTARAALQVVLTQ